MGHPLVQLVERASHVQRLCPRCSGLVSSPGLGSFAACHPHPSLILCTVISEALLSIKPYKGRKCINIYFCINVSRPFVYILLSCVLTLSNITKNESSSAMSLSTNNDDNNLHIIPHHATSNCPSSLTKQLHTVFIRLLTEYNLSTLQKCGIKWVASV